MTDKQREAWVLFLVFLASSGLLFWTAPPHEAFSGVADKLLLAVMVAVVVRIALLIPSEPKGDIYRSSKTQYETALQKARSSVSICQTWLPGGGTHETWLLANPQLKIRLLLSSFKPDSHIRSRLAGRHDIPNEAVAMSNVFQSAHPFVRAGKQNSLRFNYGHHPGWITIVDDRDVFWGPTPVDVDNNTRDYFFHKDTVDGTWGKFWKGQFELLWETNSHDYGTEANFNKNFASHPGSPG